MEQLEDSVKNTGSAYDDVFRTLLEDCTELIIPVINEAFHTSYPDDEKVELLDGNSFITEHGGKQKKLITDSHLLIGDKRYHLECQSTQDNTMLLRMFEYDSQIAIGTSEINEDTLTLRFPESGIMYLRHNAHTPDKMQICIEAPNGSCSYEIPVVKVQTYSTEKLFNKDLLFLVPFHIFAYEKMFSDTLFTYAHYIKLIEEMETDFREVRQLLDDAVRKERLTEYTKCTLKEMSKKVLNQIARGYSHIRERIGVAMYGQVLEYEAKSILREGEVRGISIGEERAQKAYKRRSLVAYQEMLEDGIPAERAMHYMGLTPEDVKEL